MRQVPAANMAPMHVAPVVPVRIVLVKHVPDAVMEDRAVRVVDPIRGRGNVINGTVRIGLDAFGEFAVTFHRACDGFGIVAFEPGVCRGKVKRANKGRKEGEQSETPHEAEGKNCWARGEDIFGCFRGVNPMRAIRNSKGSRIKIFRYGEKNLVSRYRAEKRGTERVKIGGTGWETTNGHE
jgi:hypothetical protein